MRFTSIQRVGGSVVNGPGTVHGTHSTVVVIAQDAAEQPQLDSGHGQLRGRGEVVVCERSSSQLRKTIDVPANPRSVVVDDLTRTRA